MSDRIADIFQRDLDQLPVLPRERWVPPARRSPRIATALLLVAAGTAVAVGGVFVGGALRALRSGDVSSPAAASPTPAIAARITRQAALANGRTLAARVDRIEAKLIRRDQLDAIGFGPAMGDLFWVVALAGERPVSFGAPCCVPGPDELRHGMNLYDARSGLVVAGTAGTDYWPAAFDQLRDESLAPDSRSFNASVVEQRLPDVLVVQELPLVSGAPPIALRADGDTAYTWTAGLMGGTAFSFEEMARYVSSGQTVAVTIAGTPLPDGTYRLEHLVNLTR